MQNSMYTALFGALANEHRMNSIANNLANVNTTGYKADVMAFENTLALYAHDQIMEPMSSVRSEKLFPEPQHLSRARVGEAITEFAQGAMKVTGAAFDVAITGDGFFKIRTPQGDYYTRNGHFRLTTEGMVITEQGFPVLSDGGEITVPPGIGNFSIAENGDIYADDAPAGQLSLVNVDDTRKLEKLGGNMYRARPGANIVETEATGSVAQGFLEISNVNPVYEMVNMIEAQRQFEAYAKVMQTTEAIDKEAISKVGRGRG